MNIIKCPHQAYGAAMPSSSLQLLRAMRQAAFYGTAYFTRPVYTRNLFTLLLLVWTMALSAQKLDWVVRPSAPDDNIIGGDEQFNDIARDAAGNLLVTGSFSLTADFDPGPGRANLIGKGTGKDIFVAKYDATGQYLWAFNLGEAGQDEGFGITSDASGNVYVTGYCEGTGIDFDPGPGLAILDGTGPNNESAFVAKYSPAGDYLWAFGISGDSIGGRNIRVDGNGDVFVAGHLYPTGQVIDFDPGLGTTNFNPGNPYAFFVAKYSAGGAYQWAQVAGNDTEAYIEDLELDGSGNILLAGAFFTGVDFDPGPGQTVPGNGGNSDGFVAKYDPSGNLVWVRALENAGSCTVRDLALDQDGNLLLTGQYSGAGLDLDPGTGSTSVSSLGETDIFLAKYDAAGTYQWGFGIGSDHADGGSGLAVDPDGNAYLSGYFAGPGVDFDPGSGTANLSTLADTTFNTDAFVAKYAANGGYLWAKNAKGTGNDSGSRITTDGNGNIYAAGYFSGSNADFDPGPAQVLMSAGYLLNRDGFIWNLTKDGQYGWAVHVGLYGSDFYGAMACNKVARDAAGNVYVTGQIFGYNIDMDPGPGEALLSATGELSDAYFAKYDANGNFVWAKRVGGVDFDYGAGIALDADGNIYLLASSWLETPFDYDPGPGEALLAPEPGVWLNTIVAKYDNDGNYLWAKLLQSCDPRALTVDDNGNTYFTGQFVGTDIDFDPGPGTAYMSTVDDDYNIFMARFDADGNYVWAKSMGGDSYESAWAIALDPDGNVCLGGEFDSDLADFDPGPGEALLTLVKQGDMFLAKYTAGGEYLWARSAGGKGSEEVRGVATDGSGNIYIAGLFFGTGADFDPGPGTLILDSAEDTSDIFLAKYTPSGDLVWARDFGENDQYEQCFDLALDANGALYIAGDYRSKNPAPGQSAIMVSKFDNSGNHVATTGSGMYTYGVHARGDGEVVVGGSFYDTVDFDPGDNVVEYTSHYQYGDLFIARYDFSGLTRSIDLPDSGVELLQNRPNPFSGSTTIGFILPEAGDARLRIFDATGRLLAERNGHYPAGKSEEAFEFSGISGVLFYELVTPSGTQTRTMTMLAP